MGGRGSASRRSAGGGNGAGGAAETPDAGLTPIQAAAQEAQQRQTQAERHSRTALAATRANNEGDARAATDRTVAAASRADDLTNDLRRTTRNGKGPDKVANRAFTTASAASDKAGSAAGTSIRAYESKFGTYKYNPTRLDPLPKK